MQFVLLLASLLSYSSKLFLCYTFLHCQVNLNSVWSGIGLMENNLLGAQQETRLRVEELEDRSGSKEVPSVQGIRGPPSVNAGVSLHITELYRWSRTTTCTPAALGSGN